MIIHMDKPLPPQPPEKEEGNKEYKRYLSCRNSNPDCKKKFIDKRASQMLYRLIEGDGKAVYLLGVDDDGTIFSLRNELIYETIDYLKLIANKIDANIIVIRIYNNNVCSVRIQLPLFKLKNIKREIF